VRGSLRQCLTILFKERNEKRGGGELSANNRYENSRADCSIGKKRRGPPQSLHTIKGEKKYALREFFIFPPAANREDALGQHLLVILNWKSGE